MYTELRRPGAAPRPYFVATGFNPRKKVTRAEPMSAVGTVHLERCKFCIVYNLMDKFIFPPKPKVYQGFKNHGLLV